MSTTYANISNSEHYKTQQSDLLPFYSEHTLASPWLESAYFAIMGGNLGEPPRILYWLTHYRGEKSASFINWKIETVGVCY